MLYFFILGNFITRCEFITIFVYRSININRNEKIHYVRGLGGLATRGVAVRALSDPGPAAFGCGSSKPETLYHRDDALLYIAYVMLIWAAPIPADRLHCSLWP